MQSLMPTEDSLATKASWKTLRPMESYFTDGQKR